MPLPSGIAHQAETIGLHLQRVYYKGSPALVKLRLCFSCSQALGYEALWMNSKLSARMLEVLMNGISTRDYKQVIPQMSAVVGPGQQAA